LTDNFAHLAAQRIVAEWFAEELHFVVKQGVSTCQFDDSRAWSAPSARIEKCGNIITACGRSSQGGKN